LDFRFRLKKEECGAVKIPLDIFSAQEGLGLTAEQVSERVQKGYENAPVDPPGKTTGQIILTNVFTYFNIVFFTLAAFIIFVRSWNDLMFMGVVIVNTIIGIVQELRSKRMLDKLILLNAPKATVVRGGEMKSIDTAHVVRDDIAVFSAGNQIYADALVLSGSCYVNESLITGEADEIKKQPGDALLSGSFVVSGLCNVRVTAVGADSYANHLVLEAKKSKKRPQGEMMKSLSSLVKWIGIIIIPFGVILCVKEVIWLGRSFEDGVVSTVAALIGMIPEGLYLLTSLALVASILRLARRRTIVHEMSCIETLARVDVLCVDKTGTITESKMVVENIHLLCEDRFEERDIEIIMSDYVYSMRNDNETMAALKKYFSGAAGQTAIESLPFSSTRKYGGVSFHEDETYLLGAPEILLGDGASKYQNTINFYSSKGCRVLLLAMYDGRLSDAALKGAVMPLALILLSNKIRAAAPETFKYFAGQGVAIKVISGDNPITVSEVARRAGVENAEHFIDARDLTDDKQLFEAAAKYTVFGRVTPEQKRSLVKALKKQGHTVAMTGDGVNDVLALKEADCSIAMASGSEVASQLAHIVLLKSDFSVMPAVVQEGRRVINNIQRSATLFLAKNIFSFALAFVSLVFTLPYPFTAAQLSLVSVLTIGFPAFVMAMEPNSNRITGRFMVNVIKRAAPAAITNFVLIIGLILVDYAFHLGEDMLSTICAIIMGVVGIFVTYRLCQPMTRLRRLLLFLMCGGFVLGAVFLRELFTLSPLNFSGGLILVIFALLAWPTLKGAYGAMNWLLKKIKRARGSLAK